MKQGVWMGCGVGRGEGGREARVVQIVCPIGRRVEHAQASQGLWRFSFASSMPKVGTLLVHLALVVYGVLFVVFRGGELAYLLELPATWVTGFVAYAVTPSRWRNLRTICLAAFLAAIYVMDVHFQPALPPDAFLGQVAVVTGGNSGTGFETARTLAAHGATVYLGCRNTRKCAQAADAINAAVVARPSPGRAVVPAALDLSKLESVAAFAAACPRDINVLVNNAGYSPSSGDGPTADGFAPGFGSMHLGHWLLTEQVLARRTGSPPTRVVNVASGTHYTCISFDCFDEAWWSHGVHAAADSFAYVRAKAANVLHAWALPHKHGHPGPLVEALSVNLGWVGTNIQPWMRWTQPLGLTRSPAYGIAPIIHAIVVPVTAQNNGRVVNGLLGITRPFVETNKALLVSMMATRWGKPERARETSSFTHEEAASLRDRLWDESERLVQGAQRTEE